MILPLPLSADTLPTGGHYNCATADDDSVISLRAVPNTLRRVLFDPNPRDRIKRCCSAFFRRRRRSNRSGVNPLLRGGRCQRVRWLAGRPTYARLPPRRARVNPSRSSIVSGRDRHATAAVWRRTSAVVDVS